MSNFISNLRNKPENFRIKILWVSVFVCMIIVVGIWFFDLQGNMQKQGNDTSFKKTITNIVEEVNVNNVKSDIQTSMDEFLGKDMQVKKTENEQVEENIEKKAEPNKAYQLPLE